MQKILVSIMTFYYFYIVALMFYMFKTRKKAVIEKIIPLKHFKSYQGETPEYLQILQNHFNNQFQIPLIFFVVCLLSLQQNAVNNFTIGLAICFVISRICHTLIHLGSNHIMNRAMSYFTGAFIVGLMFILILFSHG